VRAREAHMRKEANTWFLLALAAVALYLCYLVAEPFLNPIFAALVLAIVFYPLHTRIESRLRRPNMAAILSTILVLLIVAIPAAFLAMVVTGELGDLYHALSEKSAAQGGASPYLMHLLERPLHFLGRYIDFSRFDLRSTLLGWINQVSKYLVTFGATAVSNIFSLILAIVVAFFTLFFFLRDGPRIQHRVATLLPLTPQQSQTLLNRISETIVASVYGGIAVGLVQGSLTGLAFWVLGLPSPVVWGLVATMASLVPVVGTGMVWIPGAVVLLIEGHWVKSLILIGWGAAVVAQVDAVVRPYVVSGRAKMNNLLIFFALLGGVRAFGIMGLFIGPVVVAVAIAVLDMLREINLASAERERRQTAESGVSSQESAARSVADY
jgi:predicted PurR-regulated permease PerM